jgi:hypothetical protein
MKSLRSPVVSWDVMTQVANSLWCAVHTTVTVVKGDLAVSASISPCIFIHLGGYFIQFAWNPQSFPLCQHLFLTDNITHKVKKSFPGQEIEIISLDL